MSQTTHSIIYWIVLPWTSTPVEFSDISRHSVGHFEQSSLSREDVFEIWYSYRQTSNIRRTSSQNLNVSSPVLQLSLPDPLSR